MMHRPRWPTETLVNFTYPSGISPIPSNTSQKSGNHVLPVNMLSTCALQSWRLNLPSSTLGSSDSYEIGSSFLYCKETTLTFQRTSSRPTPRLMLRQTLHQQLPLPSPLGQGQPRKLRKGLNGKRNSTLQAPLLISDKEAMRKQRISS